MKLPKFIILVAAVCYCFRLFRPCLTDYPAVLWWVGFLPNFGSGLGGPMLILELRSYFLKNRPPATEQWFVKVCGACLLYLLVYEFFDSTDLRPERVFDWWDVGASVVGVGLNWGIFRWKIYRNTLFWHS